MFKSLALGLIVFAGIARADVPPMHPDPMPVPDHPGPIEPDVPDSPDNLMVAIGAILAAAGVAGTMAARRRR